MVAEPTPSTNASNRPPASAPDTLPRPPSTQTTNALPRTVDEVSGEIGKISAISTPAHPASAAPRPKARAKVRLPPTPIRTPTAPDSRTHTTPGPTHQRHRPASSAG